MRKLSFFEWLLVSFVVNIVLAGLFYDIKLLGLSTSFQVLSLIDFLLILGWGMAENDKSKKKEAPFSEIDDR